VSQIKVLIIEPEARIRIALVAMLNDSSEITVVGASSNVMQARMQLRLHKPNALILASDQKSDAAGNFLIDLMDRTPLPVLILSAKILASTEGEKQAVRLGCCLLLKPCDAILNQDQAVCKKIIEQLQHIILKFKSTKPAQNTPSKPRQYHSSSILCSNVKGKVHNPILHTLVAIGASTGGTEALRHVISKFPADFPAVLIVQHIPKAFADTFINKLNQSSAMQVISAVEGAQVHQGHIYVGAGDEHFSIEKKGMGLICRVGGKDKISGHCPSVNELFDSVALHAGSKAIGVLMTGMGDDGASGLKKMRDGRAKTVAQDKESSVVWGMPGSAVKLGAAQMEVGLDKLGEKIIQLLK